MNEFYVASKFFFNFFSVNYVGKGRGGLCEAPKMEERRQLKAKKRGGSDQVY